MKSHAKFDRKISISYLFEDEKKNQPNKVVIRLATKSAISRCEPKQGHIIENSVNLALTSYLR